ncbi:MAG: DMT family transporter [Firmicutes bacterium]|nr:DMT family transporter [Bacillota bacterium]
MIFKVIYIITALLSGAAMALQGSLNSALGKIIGLWEATLLVHIIGTATVGALILLTPLDQGELAKLPQTPWYTLLGGILSVAIIALVAYSIPQLGVAIATTAIIVAQVSTALLIDHLGLFGLQAIPFTWQKLAGMLFLAAGALLMLYKP